jgi:cellulose synthase/poly-beta-1,6-N-acetylglucosamine synthase-like glycosyltransferase
MKISLLIPCHNEEKGIKNCIKSSLSQTRPIDEIIIVNDGSTDGTKEIIDAYVDSRDNIKLINLEKNTGNKSKAQEAGLPHVTGDIVVMTDADTVLDERFIENIENRFNSQKNNKLAAVAGYVKSIKYNWLTACREIDYVIGFDVFKQAQSLIGYVFVMPGCATAIRTEVLKKLSFNHDTVTEDLDFTYQIHRMNLKIVFEKNAVVYTQDPPNLPSYIRQMKRWYGGGWQNFMKYYKIVFGKPSAAFELSLMFIDGLAYSLFLFFLMIFYPILFFTKVIPFYLLMIFIVSLYAGFKRSRLDLVLVAPLYLFIIFLNAWISIEQFFSEVVFRKRKLIWLKADRV